MAGYKVKTTEMNCFWPAQVTSCKSCRVAVKIHPTKLPYKTPCKPRLERRQAFFRNISRREAKGNHINRAQDRLTLTHSLPLPSFFPLRHCFRSASATVALGRFPLDLAMPDAVLFLASSLPPFFFSRLGIFFVPPPSPHALLNSYVCSTG